jgi:hypothetical protein
MRVGVNKHAGVFSDFSTLTHGAMQIISTTLLSGAHKLFLGPLQF